MNKLIRCAVSINSSINKLESILREKERKSKFTFDYHKEDNVIYGWSDEDKETLSAVFNIHISHNSMFTKKWVCIDCGDESTSDVILMANILNSRIIE